MSRRALAPVAALGLALSLSAPAAAAEFGGSRSIYLSPQWPVAQALNSELGLDVAISAQRAAIGAPYGEATTGSDLGAVELPPNALSLLTDLEIGHLATTQTEGVA